MTTSETDRRRREVVARLLTLDGKPKTGLKDASPLNSADVAALFWMSERAIRLWAAKGELPHTRTLGGGRLRYPADEIASLYTQHYPDSLSRGRSPSLTSTGGRRRRAS